MAERPRRGRPRDPAKDVAVLEAALGLLGSEGPGFTMDRVAAIAGVSKMTVYSRWPSKGDLVGAALAHLQLAQPPAVSGDLRTDLVAVLDTMRRQYADVGGMAIIGNCLVDEATDGELLAVVRASTIAPRREQCLAVLRRGVVEGRVLPDQDLDGLVSLLFGVLYADHLAGRSWDGPGWAARVVDQVLPAIARG